ncbi:MAG: hypothetical protein O7G13_09965, partial [Alphaproteobacteria bacterium]|nr:hypothetical protein [Alphaproteobacteria bacterium]
DIYENPFFGGNKKSNPLYRPALNVVKGQHTDDVCKSALEDNLDIAMAYPRDRCFRPANSCPDGRWGTWGWQDDVASGDGVLGAQYWQTNHNNPLASPPGDPVGPPPPVTPKLYAEMTRYEVYRHEIDSIIPNNSAEDPDGGENAQMNPTELPGAPQCYTGGTLSDSGFDDPTTNADDNDPANIDRRIFTLAVVNCLQYEIDSGSALNGNESDVPVIGFIDLFLTEPAVEQGSSKANIYAEVVRVAPIGLNGLRDIVQLYR